MPATKKLNPDHEYFLNDLRESGTCNMYGAWVYLCEEFPELSRDQARAIVRQWMDQKVNEFNGEEN